MLFVAEKPVGRSELARIVGATPRAVESALADLAVAYEGTGLRLQRSGDEWQIVTAPQLSQRTRGNTFPPHALHGGRSSTRTVT